MQTFQRIHVIYFVISQSNTGYFFQFLAFVKKNEEILKDSDQTVRQAVETAKNNVRWRKNNLETVAKLMKETLDAAGSVI